VLPCLNEAETLATVINKSKISILKNSIDGEIIVADNGSADGSQAIALSLGARVIDVPIRGYGAALQAGITAALGKFVIMGDADDSYALDELEAFIVALKDGSDLVMGNRFAGGIEKGAMPWLHKYIGNPLLSWMGRLFFRVTIKDFHCGLRGFNRESIIKLKLSSKGMEFASEMVVKAAVNGLRIVEVPTTLKPDGRSRSPHLRTWRDGWRHLTFLLAASPRWLFIHPGVALLLIGFIGGFSTLFGAISVGRVSLDLNTYFLSLAMIIVGLEIVLMGILAKIFATHHGILPKTKNVSRFESYFTLERGITLGLFLILTAIIGLSLLIFDWSGNSFNYFDTSTSLRISGFFILSIISGTQILFASFFASMLQG
jgi:glycosyltransferase involved in cell wall biosynthesis